MEQNEFKRLINHETLLTKFFRELGLKPNHRQLIIAFIIASKGENVFEASFAELGNIISSGSRPDTNAKNAFKGLQKWQERSQIELIRIITPGHIVKDREGTKTFIKTKYEFVALEELMKAFYSNESNLDSVIEKLLVDIKAKYQSPEKKKKYHPLENYKRAKNSIFTFIKNVFIYSKQANLDPVAICNDVINKSQQIILEMKNDWDVEQNLNRYLKDFESLLAKKDDEYQGELHQEISM